MIATPDYVEAYVPSVEDDRVCVGCAYNLRGLLVTGNCPECGSPVEQSLHGDELWRSDPQWLLCLRWGMTLMAVMTLGGLLWRVAIHFFRIDFQGVLPLYMLGMISMSGVSVILTYLITAREPRTLGNTTRASIRFLARILLVVSHVGSCAVGIGFMTTTDVNRYVIYLAIYGLLYLCGTIGSILLLLLLRGYAKRMNATFIAYWLLFHLATSAALGLLMSLHNISESLVYFLGWDPVIWWYEWGMAIRTIALPVDGLVFLPLAVIYHYKLEAARRRSLASRTI